MSCPSGTLHQYTHPIDHQYIRWGENEGNKRLIDACSDGIARVHGMSNVQAEELVE